MLMLKVEYDIQVDTNSATTKTIPERKLGKIKALTLQLNFHIFVI